MHTLILAFQRLSIRHPRTFLWRYFTVEKSSEIETRGKWWIIVEIEIGSSTNRSIGNLDNNDSPVRDQSPIAINAQRNRLGSKCPANRAGNRTRIVRRNSLVAPSGRAIINELVRWITKVGERV